MIAALGASKAKRILIAFDRDEAGDRGAAKLAEKVVALGIEVRRVVFPKGMDANAYACRVKPASKSLGLLIRKAEWIGRGQALQKKEVMPEVVTNCDHLALGHPSLAAQAVVGEEPAAKKKIFIAEQSTATEEALPAAAQPPMAAGPVPAEVSEREIVLSFGEGSMTRRWRVRGLPKNLAVGALKVHLMVTKSSRSRQIANAGSSPDGARSA